MPGRARRAVPCRPLKKAGQGGGHSWRWLGVQRKALPAAALARARQDFNYRRARLAWLPPRARAFVFGRVMNLLRLRLARAGLAMFATFFHELKAAKVPVTLKDRKSVV